MCARQNALVSVRPYHCLHTFVMNEMNGERGTETGKLEGHGLGGALVRHVGSRVGLGVSMAVLPLMSFSRSNTMKA